MVMLSQLKQSDKKTTYDINSQCLVKKKHIFFQEVQKHQNTHYITKFFVHQIIIGILFVPNSYPQGIYNVVTTNYEFLHLEVILMTIFFNHLILEAYKRKSHIHKL